MHQDETAQSQKTRDTLAWFAGAVVLAVIGFYFAPRESIDVRADYLNTWSDLPLIGLVAFAIAFRRPPSASGREHRFWIAWAAGFGCWFVGRLGWGVFWYVGLPIDLIGDFFFMLLYVGLLIGLEHDPGGPAPSGFEKRLRQLTTGGGVILLLAIFVYFTLIPALVKPDTYDSWKPAVLGTVVFDTYVFVRLYGRYRQTRDPYWQQVYRWLATGFGLWVITDALDVYTTFHAIEILEEGMPLYLFWYVPNVLLVCGVLVSRKSHSPSEIAARKNQPVTMAGPLGGTPLLVYVFILPLTHVALNQAGLADADLRGAREILLAVSTAVMAGIIYKTHRMVLAKNRHLSGEYESVSQSLAITNQGLEERVRQRTAELEIANRHLAQDLEQRDQTERRMRAAEARNRALIQAVPDALILVDHRGLVQDIYSGRTKLEDVDLQSVQGSALSNLIPVEHRSEVAYTLGLIRDGVKAEAGPLALEYSGGTQHLEFRFGRCGEDEILVVIQDVTERRAFESSLQQSQKLESLGVMAGGIAHDFNNLLTGILGNAQLSREILTEETAVDARLAAIENCATRAAKLTNNLLAYAGEAHIEREPLNLVTVFTEMETLLAAAIPKRASFEMRIGSEPLWVMGNEAQLTQILLNLARNATESLTDGNGSVLVDMGLCQIPDTGVNKQILGDKPAPGQYVRLRVQDTGSGMTSETQKRIFDPFFTSKGTGRGLGLAAVLGIVSHHDGALSLDSTLGQGTEFSVYFPACEDPELRSNETAKTQLLSGMGTILVADDENGVRQLITAFLNRHGIATIEAADGAQAVEIARNHQGQLAAIVMDYAMPKLTGLEAYHLIRRKDADVPFILMSGYGQREALSSLVDEPRTVFLKKPFALNEFAAALNQQFRFLSKEANG